MSNCLGDGNVLVRLQTPFAVQFWAQTIVERFGHYPHVIAVDCVDDESQTSSQLKTKVRLLVAIFSLLSYNKKYFLFYFQVLRQKFFKSILKSFPMPIGVNERKFRPKSCQESLLEPMTKPLVIRKLTDYFLDKPPSVLSKRPKTNLKPEGWLTRE